MGRVGEDKRFVQWPVAMGDFVTVLTKINLQQWAVFAQARFEVLRLHSTQENHRDS
jgi:hypothetical protein